MRSKKPQKKRAGSHQLSRPDSRLAELAAKVAQGPLGPSQFVVNPKGVEKMSDVLDDFVAPYEDSAATKEEYEKLLTLAITAWNAALLPEAERSQMLEEVLGKGLPDLPKSLRKDLRAFVDELIVRKLTHFAANRRAIVDFTLQETRDGYHLSVASTLESPPSS
jgi:hypothetical protein